MKFGEAVPEMRKVVRRNLRRRDLGRDRVMACILRILSTCFLRPGSQVYANENGSYGLATLRPKHVNVRGDRVEFKFPGKGQIVHHREIRDRGVSQIVRGLLKHRAREVFKYQNGDGLFVNIRRRDINLYIKEIMGEHFTSKDFRTWAATLICSCALAQIGVEDQESAASRKRKAVKAVKETAEIIGNTPAVCRSAYICPEVLRSFEKGRVIGQFASSPEDLLNHHGVRLRKAEKSLLRLLRQCAK
jgi:DNA topoisomerase-1